MTEYPVLVFMIIKRRKIIRFYVFIGISFLFALLATGCAAVKNIVVKPYGSRIWIPKETLVGEIEPVMIKEKKDGKALRLLARIDTGAKTSSLDATNIEQFERLFGDNTETWVRFTIEDSVNKEMVEVESKLVRTAKIKGHGTESERRSIVKLWIQLGKVNKYVEFSLTDRSNFKYPVLVGRNFLDGEFVVDVSRKNITTPMSEGIRNVE